MSKISSDYAGVYPAIARDRSTLEWTTLLQKRLLTYYDVLCGDAHIDRTDIPLFLRILGRHVV